MNPKEMMNFVLKMMDFAFKMMDFAFKMLNWKGAACELTRRAGLNEL